MTGSKTFFGRSGNFDGDDIITLILQHPACPRFIAGELFKFLAYEDIDPTLGRGAGRRLCTAIIMSFVRCCGRS